jgi:hypothetical protein
MNRYKLFDFVLGSELELPELSVHESASPDWVFACGAPAAEPEPAWPWFRHCTLPDESRWLSVARTASGYCLRFWDLADFLVEMDAARIEGRPRPSTSAATLRHLLLDHVVPLLSSFGERLVLHAGGVVTPAGAVAFLGEGGRGKSTLTASFVQQGFPVLGDDALMIAPSRDGFVATPSYPGVRLSPDMMIALGSAAADVCEVAEYTTKVRLFLPPEAACPSGSVRLAAIFVLAAAAPSDELSATALSSREALVELMRHGHYVDGRDRGWLELHFQLAARVAARVPFLRLVYPREAASLAAVRAVILESATLSPPRARRGAHEDAALGRRAL